MGSLDRKMKRNQERAAFNAFTEEWSRAKHAGHLVNGKELGKKPGFSEFKRRLKLHQAVQNVEAENRLREQAAAEEKIKAEEWKEG